MSFNGAAELRSPNWVCTPRPRPERSNKLFYFEPGCEYGGKDSNGIKWYRMSCSYWFGDWIEEQDSTLWKAHGSPHRAIYIVREELITLIALTWL